MINAHLSGRITSTVIDFMNNIKCVIFDWDQTLYETFPVHMAGIQYAALECGRDVPSPADIVSGYAATIEEHLEAVLGSPIEAPLAKYLKFYYQRNLEMCKPFPHASEVLEELKSKGYALGLLSNKESRAGFQEIEFSGLSTFFDVIAFREQVPELKPKPGGLLWMLERLNVSPHEAIYIGDEPRDIQSAQLAGTISGAALWGSLHPNELRAIGPNLEWESLKAVKDSL